MKASINQDRGLSHLIVPFHQVVRAIAISRVVSYRDRTLVAVIIGPRINDVWRTSLIVVVGERETVKRGL